jgi:hemerythrin-like domain-containing protein
MNPDPHEPSHDYLESVRITDVLRVEHILLRTMMAQVSDWLAASVPPETIRERVALLNVALETHAQREEKRLFNTLRRRSDAALHLVDMMVVVHDEVRGLFEEIEAGAEPTERLWTILDLTETHFRREDKEVFPLAEELIEPEILIQLGIVGTL